MLDYNMPFRAEYKRKHRNVFKLLHCDWNTKIGMKFIYLVNE